jgi:hypothetical protein
MCFSSLNERKHSLWIQATQHQPMRGCHIGFTWIHGPTKQRSTTPANQKRAHGSKGPPEEANWQTALVLHVHLGQDQGPTKEWPRESWGHLATIGGRPIPWFARSGLGAVRAQHLRVDSWWSPRGSLGCYPLSYHLKPPDHAWAHKKQGGSHSLKANSYLPWPMNRRGGGSFRDTSLHPRMRASLERRGLSLVDYRIGEWERERELCIFMDACSLE